MAEIPARSTGLRAALAAACVTSFLVAGMASSAAQTNAFAGKDLTLIISYEPGGGTDIIARLIGNAMRRFLPGQPNIIYRNVPGAGGIVALNQFYVLPPDGLTFIAGAGNQFNPIDLKREGVRYDPTKLNVIGGIANPSEFLLIRKETLSRLTDRSATALHMAVQDGTHAGDQMSLWGAEAFGWNLKMVFGYQGTPAMMLALQQGEADMMSNNNIDIIKPPVDSGTVALVAQVGMLLDGKFLPSRLFPDVPVFANMGQEEKLEGRALAAYEVWKSYSQIGKWFALPPQTPDGIVTLYRQAFHAAVSDPEFQQAFQSRISPELYEMAPQDLAKLLQDMVAATKGESYAYLDELTKKYRK
jgi:tripartite-type tricarboxylate transporter receptor subunit TctC